MKWYRTLLWLVTISATLLGLLWIFQRRLIYLPTAEVPPVENLLPGWVEETLSTEDGLELGAWYSAPQQGQPVIIFFPGNAGNRADRVDIGAGFARQGFGVLLVDYRGYGGNPGSPTEAGLAGDARAAYSFVQARGHGTVLFGESLGAAVAIELATAEPVDALILRSPFTSLADAAAAHYPFLPVRVLLHDRYPSHDRIAAVNAPVLIVAGTADSIVPPRQSRALYESALEPKELLILEGLDHNDFDLVAGQDLIDTATSFIRKHTG